jgi:ribose transport system substrate-binding protein
MKRTERSRVLALSMVACLGLALTACTSTGESASSTSPPSPAAAGASSTADGGSTADETYYWISMMSTLPLFLANDKPAWDMAASQLGVNAEMVGPTDQNLSQFLATIDQVCAGKPAGVAIVGWDPSVATSIDKCMDEGVPVVTVDADVANSKRLSFVGSDWYQLGVTQAKALMDAAPPGQVATLSIVGVDIMKQAVDGFKDTLEGTGYTVVANESSEGSLETAVTKTASLLAAYPDLVGIAAFDSNSGPGAVRALTEAGKVGEVKVTAVEDSKEFLNTLKSGAVSAIIAQKRELFTYYGLKMLYDYNHNGLKIQGLDKTQASPIPTNVETGLFLITPDNVDQVLANQQ